ncbi:MAG: DUF4148 domain-containing protein [Polaromonas sp.]
MALKLIPAALVAVAALAAASSFAQGARSRADVNAELMEAQSRGYSLSSTSPYPPAAAQAGTPKTRDEVMSELRDAQSRVIP